MELINNIAKAHAGDVKETTCTRRWLTYCYNIFRVSRYKTPAVYGSSVGEFRMRAGQTMWVSCSSLGRWEPFFADPATVLSVFPLDGVVTTWAWNVSPYLHGVGERISGFQYRYGGETNRYSNHRQDWRR